MRSGRLLSYDIEAQCRAVFANVRTILDASGAHWEDLVDITVFLTDMAHDFATYNRVYAEYFTATQPCRTTLGISALTDADRHRTQSAIDADTPAAKDQAEMLDPHRQSISTSG